MTAVAIFCSWEKPRRQMQVMARVASVMMSRKSILPMRMMRTAAQQQVLTEGEERKEGDHESHVWIVGQAVHCVNANWGRCSAAEGPAASNP